MAQARIPVDLFNPGEVLACLGLLEAVDTLRGEAEGGFDWDHPETGFTLRAAGEENPVEVVLAFLAEANPRRLAPPGYADPPTKGAKKKGAKPVDPDEDDEGGEDGSLPAPEITDIFPAPEPDRMTLPVRILGGAHSVILDHWADGSTRDPFKLYSGNRSAFGIAGAMIAGVAALWRADPATLTASPFAIVTPMGGSFNFDPRKGWTAINVGYSPDRQKHALAASPVVEILAAWGLQHARPREHATRLYGYDVWQPLLPPMLARAALAQGLPGLPHRRFRARLDLSGKNKVVTFATEETR